MATDDPPALAALFLAKFDQKIGYTITWKRNRDDLDLDGIEYHCFPSGLHDVHEDLVYYTKDAYAGLSAFVQEGADEAHRNADFVAVGVLVSAGNGGHNKSWLHAQALRELAKNVLASPEDTNDLAAYWAQYNLSYGTGRSYPPSSTDEPLLSISKYLATFGPLVFPLYRASLLRKRVLMLGKTPVQPACNFGLSRFSALASNVLTVLSAHHLSIVKYVRKPDLHVQCRRFRHTPITSTT
jgi:hypothetical protein